MWAVEQRIEEINRQSVEQAQRLLLDAIECCLPDKDVLEVTNFYRAERRRLRQSQVWRDKARPGDDIRVFDWGAVGGGCR